MKRLGHVFAIVTLFTSALEASCGGAAADKVRPKDLTAKDALGGPAAVCSGEPKLARPLIVDLESDVRIDLEASMKQNVVVVSYDCNELRVLSNCKVPGGSYEYAGASRDEKVVQLKGADELKVNLPLSAGKLGADVQAGHSIDLGLILVGRRSTVVAKVKREDLQGPCDGATHFLQKAYVGAFSMTTGSGAKLAAAADLFKVGVSGTSESSRNATSSAGSLESCRTSNPDADAPPPECRSSIRVELIPIAGHAEKKPEAASAEAGDKAENKPEAPADKSSPDPKKANETAEENPCRAGYVFADGICTASKDVAFLCDPKDNAVCKAQCGKGNLGSCYNYGVYQHRLDKAGKTDEDPSTYFKKACDGGHNPACGALGRELHPTHAEDNLDDFQQAFDLEKKACDAGDARSCWWLGLWQRDKTSPKTYSPEASFKTYMRGCALGDAPSCVAAAGKYIVGDGVAKDVTKGLDLEAKACASGIGSLCLAMADDLWLGMAGKVPIDVERAVGISKKVCDDEDADDKPRACDMTAEMLAELGRADDALKYATLACNMDTGNGCYALYGIYSGKGAKKNPAGAQTIYKKICDDPVNSIFDGFRVTSPKEKPICKENLAAAKAPATKTKTKGKPKAKK